MKIIHVMNWYIPGMGYQENFLPAEQKKLGHDVTIITSTKLPLNFKELKSEKYLKDIEYENGVKIFRLKPYFCIYKGEQLALRGLKDILIKLKPDVIQCHGAFSSLTIITLLLNKRNGFKIYIDDHTHRDNFKLNKFFKYFYLFFMTKFYYLMSSDICYWLPITLESESILKSFLNIDESKIRMIPLGVDTNIYSYDQNDRKEIRKKFFLSDHDKLIIYAGKLGSQKKIEILIASFSELRKKFENIKLMIVGTGDQDYFNYLQKIVEKMELSADVIFIPFLEKYELKKFFCAADIGVWPGTCTITSIEALGTGLPVILPEDDMAYGHLYGKNFILTFTKDSVDSLINSLTLFLLNDGTIMARTGIESYMHRNLSWSVLSKKTIDLYLES